MSESGKTNSRSTQILVPGSRGMLGQDLVRCLTRAGFRVTGLTSSELDITQHRQVIDCLREYAPRLVVNCAAYTAVDKAETEKDLAFAVNRDGAAHLADGCRSIKAALIHISTDYIFDGASKRPYKENDPAAPLGVYGLSKWQGEQEIRNRLTEHLIIRTAWLYGLFGPNFVKTMLRLAREREVLKVVADQQGCPTWTMHLAQAIVTLVGKILDPDVVVDWGTYHYCGKGATTWHAFAEVIISEARQYENLAVKEIIPIGTDAYPTPAKRPANSVLDCSKIKARFNIQPQPWRPTLARFIKMLLVDYRDRITF